MYNAFQKTQTTLINDGRGGRERFTEETRQMAYKEKHKKSSNKNRTSNKPVLQVKDYFPVTASIWKNTMQVDGEDKAVFGATFQRVYKDKKGDYKQSDSMNKAHCLLLARCAEKVADALIELEAKERLKEQNDDDDDDDDE